MNFKQYFESQPIFIQKNTIGWTRENAGENATGIPAIRVNETGEVFIGTFHPKALEKAEIKYPRINFNQVDGGYVKDGKFYTSRSAREEVQYYFESKETKVLYLMRGISGSGKSFFAHKIHQKEGGVSYSTDEFHYKNGVYMFDPEMKIEYHSRNIQRAEEAMKEGISPVIIDNTNIKFEYAEPYIKSAIKYGYEVRVIEPTTPWAFDVKELAKRNSGRAPIEVIQQMLDEYEPHNEFMAKLKQILSGIILPSIIPKICSWPAC